jgi:hypothetical protein
MTGYSPTGLRDDAASDGWPFGTLTDLQMRRLEEQRRALERLERERLKRAADEARRNWAEALL